MWVSFPAACRQNRQGMVLKGFRPSSFRGPGLERELGVAGHVHYLSPVWLPTSHCSALGAGDKQDEREGRVRKKEQTLF